MTTSPLPWSIKSLTNTTAAAIVDANGVHIGLFPSGMNASFVIDALRVVLENDDKTRDDLRDLFLADYKL